LISCGSVLRPDLQRRADGGRSGGPGHGRAQPARVRAPVLAVLARWPCAGGRARPGAARPAREPSWPGTARS